MSLEIVWALEIGFVARHDRELRVIGRIDQERLHGALLRKTMTLQLHIQAVTEDAFESIEGRLGKSEIVRGERAIDNTVRTAGEGNEALMVESKMIKRDQRVTAFRAVAIGFGRKLDKIGVTLRVLGE